MRHGWQWRRAGAVRCTRARGAQSPRCHLPVIHSHPQAARRAGGGRRVGEAPHLAHSAANRAFQGEGPCRAVLADAARAATDVADAAPLPLPSPYMCGRGPRVHTPLRLGRADTTRTRHNKARIPTRLQGGHASGHTSRPRHLDARPPAIGRQGAPTRVSRGAWGRPALVLAAVQRGMVFPPRCPPHRCNTAWPAGPPLGHRRECPEVYLRSPLDPCGALRPAAGQHFCSRSSRYDHRVCLFGGEWEQPAARGSIWLTGYF